MPRQQGRRDARDPGAVVDAIDELRELIGQVLNGQPDPNDRTRHPATGPLDDQR
ncbi:hypothetical protein [Micromonospora sp. LH3U1]|uniref:hypothetical protein n=1 Tax=Micromonospora sp. LH3U1 TaxID=3018339 RepID=UPI00234B2651|nr:hypothetical protein [Micromonospora sp. LH3U1]WCN84063.1 hypothetical protein PCA76_13940 [Micromonospora sp. LH3U1]